MSAHSHLRPDIVTTAQAMANLSAADRAAVLDALHLGDVAVFRRMITGAIADDQAARLLNAIHVPSFMAQAHERSAWVQAARKSAEPGMSSDFASRLPQHFALLNGIATEANAAKLQAQGKRGALIQKIRDIEARRDHYRGANIGLAEIELQRFAVRVTQIAIVTCELGAVGAVLAVHFGIGTGISLSHVPVMNRALWVFMTLGLPPLTYWIAHFIVGEVAKPGSRLRHASLPLAFASLTVCTLVLLGIRYASSVDTASLTTSLGELGTAAVGTMSAVIGLVGSFVAAGLGLTMPKLLEQKRQLESSEVRFANELRDCRQDLAELEAAVVTQERHIAAPALARAHFEQAVVNAIALRDRFAVETERRMAAAESALAQLLALSVPDREQVDILLRTLVTTVRQSANDGEAA